MEEMKTEQLLITGYVQGVGMRYFIRRTATMFDLKGYVRNLSNGKVECLVQGSENVIDRFVTYIKQNSPGRIDNLEIATVQTETAYHKFGIKLF